MSTHLLCYLTDVRTEEVKKGRYAGTLKSYRLAVLADKWCWMISRQNIKPDGSTYPFVFQKSGGCFRLLFPMLQTNYVDFRVDPWDAVKRVKKSLHELTGREFKYSGPKDLAKVGRAMDEFYQCSSLTFRHPTDWCEKLFQGRNQVKEC